jgi:hypothetical protein
MYPYEHDSYFAIFVKREKLLDYLSVCRRHWVQNKWFWLGGWLTYGDIISNLTSFTFFWCSPWCSIMADFNTKFYTVQVMCTVPGAGRPWVRISTEARNFYSSRQTVQTGSEDHLQLLFYHLFCMSVKLGLSYWGRNVSCWMFESRVQRKTFGPKKDEGIGEWRILHNEELCGLYCSPNIIRAIKSRKMRWVGHVARMTKERWIQGFGGGDLTEWGHLKDLVVDGRIILRWIFKMCSE